MHTLPPVGRSRIIGAAVVLLSHELTAAPTGPAPSSDAPPPAIWIGATVLAVALLAVAGWVLARTRMKRWTVPARLGVGFGSILLLLLVVAGAGSLALYRGAAGFTEYRTDARNSVLAGRIQANFLKMRIAAKDFVTTESNASVQQYKERKEKVDEFVDRAIHDLTTDAHHQTILEVQRQVAVHAELFAKMQQAGSQEARHEINVKMGAIGEPLDVAVENLKLDLVANQDRVGPQIAGVMATAKLAIA